ncbi:hypothetical protein [Bacillus sp. FJAT-47783]|uniref:hypothetical protein n=1 Tax=Bacillus sp. FJAT-47783 TaxID=2922712 RepID=UPI001FAE30F1|nr:hypothetical protein [Bacillus sp. FJAT-47783]
MSEQLLQQILKEVINVNKRVDSLERELKEMRSELNDVKGELNNVKCEVNNVKIEIISFKTEFNDFHKETGVQLKILQDGQKGLLNEITERFNETNEKMDNIELDLMYTYHKVSENALKLNRLTQHPST